MGAHIEPTYGEAHWNTKYPDSDVDLARTLYEEHGMSPTLIAEKLEVPINTLWEWLKYRCRCHTTSYQTQRRKERLGR